MKPKLIGITGGIGAGKSVVSRILRTKGYQVYDCDIRAREIMNNDEGLRADLRDIFGEEAFKNSGEICREFISSKVFNDAELLTRLNNCVHRSVRENLKDWRERKGNERNYLLFVESAILKTSGLLKECDAIISVEADKNLRVRRVMNRNGLSEEGVLKRIEAQREEYEYNDSIRVMRVYNNGRESLICRMDDILNTIEG